jgi:hypothetical protein
MIVQDVRDLVAFIFRHFGPAARAGELPDDIVQCVRRLETALGSPPDDLALVSREPTKAMIDAAVQVVFREAGQHWTGDADDFAEQLVGATQRLCYAAMLEAAGAAPQAGRS